MTWQSAKQPHGENSARLSALFRFARHVANSSLQDFADILSVTADTIYAFEKNLLQLPPDKLKKACRSLRLNSHYIDDKTQNPFNYPLKSIDVPVYPKDMYEKVTDLCHVTPQARLLAITEPLQSDSPRPTDTSIDSRCHTLAMYDTHNNLVVFSCRLPTYGHTNTIDTASLVSKIASLCTHLGYPIVHSIRGHASKSMRNALATIGGLRFSMETLLMTV